MFRTAPFIYCSVSIPASHASHRVFRGGFPLFHRLKLPSCQQDWQLQNEVLVFPRGSVFLGLMFSIKSLIWKQLYWLPGLLLLQGKKKKTAATTKRRPEFWVRVPMLPQKVPQQISRPGRTLLPTAIPVHIFLCLVNLPGKSWAAERHYKFEIEKLNQFYPKINDQESGTKTKHKPLLCLGEDKFPSCPSSKLQL